MAATLHIAGQIGYPVINLGWLLPNKAEIATVARFLKNLALFVAAPFIGLAYVVALPFVGLAMLAWIGGKALVKAPATYLALIAARKAVLFAAAPFIGLVYAVLLPFVGIAMIARIGYQAYRAPKLPA